MSKIMQAYTYSDKIIWFFREERLLFSNEQQIHASSVIIEYNSFFFNYSFITFLKRIPRRGLYVYRMRIYLSWRARGQNASTASRIHQCRLLAIRDDSRCQINHRSLNLFQRYGPCLGSVLSGTQRGRWYTACLDSFLDPRKINAQSRIFLHPDAFVCRDIYRCAKSWLDDVAMSMNVYSTFAFTRRRA